MKSYICALLFALLPVSSAMADPGYSSIVSALSMNAQDIGTDVLVSGFDNPLGCTNVEWFRITNDVSNGEMMRGTLLTAFVSGKPVKVWVNSCANDGVSTVLAVWANP
jgi:hypothetical protein